MLRTTNFKSDIEVIYDFDYSIKFYEISSGKLISNIGQFSCTDSHGNSKISSLILMSNCLHLMDVNENIIESF